MTRRPFALTVAAALLLFVSAVARAGDDPPIPPAAAETGVAFEHGTPAFADVLAKAKAEGKLAFIDFATDWCGWCKKLDKDVFSKAEVAEAMKGYVAVHVDSEKGEGVELTQRFGVHGWPTLVVVDAAGEEVDRIGGYMPPDAFIKEVTRIQKGEGTLAALKKASAAAPDDVELAMKLAEKLGASNPGEAAALWTSIADKAATKDHATQGVVALGRASAVVAGIKSREEVPKAVAAVEAFMKDFGDTPAAAHAPAKLGGLLTMTDSTKTLAFLDAARAQASDAKDRGPIESLAVAIHKKEMAAALLRQGQAAGDDPAALNEAAWNCFEAKVNVKQAIGWAKTAAEKSGNDPAIVDTLANLLALTGKHAEAVKLEEEAAKKAEGAAKKEFLKNVAKWKAEAAAGGNDEDGEEGDEDDEK